MTGINTFVNVALENISINDKKEEIVIYTFHSAHIGVQKALEKIEKLENLLDVLEGKTKIKTVAKIQSLKVSINEIKWDDEKTWEEVLNNTEKFLDRLEILNDKIEEINEGYDYGELTVLEKVEEENLVDAKYNVSVKVGHKAKLSVKIGSYELIKHKRSAGNHKLYYGQVVSPGDLFGQPITIQGDRLFMKVKETYDVWGSYLNYEGENVIEGTKVIRERVEINEMELDSETFMKYIFGQYISRENEMGFLEIVDVGWKTEWAFGAVMGKAKISGDRKTQTEERLAKAFKYLEEKYGSDITRKAEKLMRVLDHEVIDMSGWGANGAKLKEANDMVQAIMPMLKSSEIAKAELKSMSKDEKWAMVPEALYNQVHKDWEEKVIKRQSRYGLIEEIKSKNIKWMIEFISEAMKFEDWNLYGKTWIEAKKIKFQNLMDKYSPVKGALAKENWIGLQAAVEFGLTHRPNMGDDLNAHLSYWWHDKEASTAIFVAAMAKMDLRYQQWMEECSGVEDNRLDNGRTHKFNLWGTELLDYVWNRGRDKEIWNPQSGTSAEKANELLRQVK